LKVCTRCNQEKDFSEFHKCKSSKDGHKPACKKCRNEWQCKWWADNPDQHDFIKAYIKKWKKENPEKEKASDRRYEKKNKEKLLARNKDWRKRTPEKQRAYREKRKEYFRTWRRNNSDKHNARTAIRRAGLKNATPPWLTKEQKQEMAAFYKSAKTMQIFHEEKFHVDHIEPLKGVNENGEHVSCGLHLPWNLQVLTESENCKKKNKISV
jgi:hypothetical protein